MTSIKYVVLYSILRIPKFLDIFCIEFDVLFIHVIIKGDFVKFNDVEYFESLQTTVFVFNAYNLIYIKTNVLFDKAQLNNACFCLCKTTKILIIHYHRSCIVYCHAHLYVIVIILGTLSIATIPLKSLSECIFTGQNQYLFYYTCLCHYHQWKLTSMAILKI